MTDIIKTLINAVVSKVGGIKGFILKKVLEVYGAKLANYLNDLYQKLKRTKEQEEALKKLEQDIKEQKPRTDEVRQNEKDFLNS